MLIVVKPCHPGSEPGRLVWSRGRKWSPAPASLVGCLAPCVGRSRAGTFSPLLHYFIRLLTNKHMETIHSPALITFSLKGMAGPGSSVRDYLNPSLTSNPPSISQSFLVMLFGGI